jgi:hypothetical protein
MSLLNLSLPIIGGTNANEDPKIRTALSDIQTVVNALDNANIASGADINGSKLDDATISAAKLAANSVETAKIVNDAVTNDKIGDDAVDTAQIADGAVTTATIDDNAVTDAKLAASTTGTATNSAAVDIGSITARTLPGNVILLAGSVLRTSGSWAVGDTIVTLPAGFRPTTEQNALGWSGGGASLVAQPITITTAGIIKVRTGLIGGVSTAGLGVDGIVFYAG